MGLVDREYPDGKERMHMRFKKDFLWGGAISANQAEGAYLEDGKGLSSFDMLPMDERRLKPVFLDRDNILNTEGAHYPSRTGIDFYHRCQDDIAMLAEMGIRCFRFSVSWSRIFPNGDDLEPNEAGMTFYENILKELRRYRIEPVITISHFDVPMHLVTEYGGWQDRRVADLYVRYACTLMERFQEYVTYWIPFNEMNMILHIPFIGGGLTFTDGENVLEKEYQAAHHQLLANALTIREGRKISGKFRFGCMLAAGKTYPLTCRPEDVMAALLHERENLFFSDVQVWGRYPAYTSFYFKEKGISIRMGTEDQEILKENTVDFVSFSYYSSACSAVDESGLEKTAANGPDTIRNPYLPESGGVWQNDPLGLRITLNHLYERYHLPLFIVENGLGTRDDGEDPEHIEDDYRIRYLRDHIKNMADAVEQDGVELIGYLTWGIIDLISVSDGRLSKRYGLIYVDGDDHGQGTGKRYKKKSFYWYKRVIETNGACLSEEEGEN